MNVRLLPAALAAALCASAAPALAGGEKKPAPYRWSVGEVVEVEVRVKIATTGVEASVTEDEGESEEVEETSDDAFEAHLVYLDRVEEVKDGRAVRLTRHYTTARALTEDDTMEPTLLEGRQVLLAHPVGRSGKTLRETPIDERGVFDATWSNGVDLVGDEFALVWYSFWPESPDEWRTDLGSRKGELDGVPTDETWPAKEYQDLPAVLLLEVADFPIAEVAEGRWEMKVEGDHAPAGLVQARIKLEGSSEEEGEEEGTVVTSDVTHAMQAKMEIRLPANRALPEPLPPPAAYAAEEEEEEGEGDEEEGDEEEGDEED